MSGYGFWNPPECEDEGPIPSAADEDEFQPRRTNLFLGIPSKVWAGYGAHFPDEPLPWSDMLGRYVTVEDIRAGIAAMLHRMDEDEPIPSRSGVQHHD